jgi:hypothetical protein
VFENPKIARLFSSMQRLERLIKVDAPESIIEAEKEILEDKKAVLIRSGFDVEKFLSSDDGQIAYLIYCSQIDLDEKLYERCGRCSLYFMKFLSSEINFGCLRFENRPVHCDAFQDTGKDFGERLWYRCCKCSLFKLSHCIKGLNEIAIECSSFIGTEI